MFSNKVFKIVVDLKKTLKYCIHLDNKLYRKISLSFYISLWCIFFVFQYHCNIIFLHLHHMCVRIYGYLFIFCVFGVVCKMACCWNFVYCLLTLFGKQAIQSCCQTILMRSLKIQDNFFSKNFFYTVAAKLLQSHLQAFSRCWLSPLVFCPFLQWMPQKANFLNPWLTPKPLYYSAQ